MAQLPKEITEPGFEDRCFSLKKKNHFYLFILFNYKKIENKQNIIFQN